MEKIIIVAVSINNVIGKDNDLPWNLPMDLKRFKAQTSGHSVIMGRKTHQSILDRIKKPLPGRENIVISNTMKSSLFENVTIVSSFEEAIKHAENLKPKKVFFIGGERVFKDSLLVADKILLTRVLSNKEGDAFLPEIDMSDWEIVFYENHVKEIGHSNDFIFMDLERK